MGAKRGTILLSLHYNVPHYLGLCWHQHLVGAGARFWNEYLPSPCTTCKDFYCSLASGSSNWAPPRWNQSESGPWECLKHVPPPHVQPVQAGAGLKKTPRQWVVWGGSSALTHSADPLQLCCSACLCRQSHDLLQNPPWLWSAEFWK